MPLFYRLVQSVLRVLVKIVFRLEVVGGKNLPRKGPAIICSNHMSVLDPVIVGCIVDPQVNFMAKEELFEIPLFSILIRKLGAVPVKRGGADRKALKAALEKLEQEGVFGLFPEGTRNKEKDKTREPLKGVGFIAAKSRATVIPVTIRGNYIPFKKMKVIAHGPMIYHKNIYEKKYEDPVQGFTREIMEFIYKDL